MRPFRDTEEEAEADEAPKAAGEAEEADAKRPRDRGEGPNEPRAEAVDKPAAKGSEEDIAQPEGGEDGAELFVIEPELLLERDDDKGNRRPVNEVDQCDEEDQTGYEPAVIGRAFHLVPQS